MSPLSHLKGRERVGRMEEEIENNTIEHNWYRHSAKSFLFWEKKTCSAGESVVEKSVLGYGTPLLMRSRGSLLDTAFTTANVFPALMGMKPVQSRNMRLENKQTTYENEWPDSIVMHSVSFGFYTSSTAQGGGGSFKNRKPIGEVGCCESGMAERSHWWTERCLISLTLSISFSDYLPTYLSIFYVSIYRSIYLSLSLSSNYPIYRSIYRPIYLSIYLSFICLSV